MAFSALTQAHPGYYGTAFHAHNLDKAKSIAQKEHKIIFVHAGDTDRGWKHFRWPKSNTSSLIDLLVREAVLVELNLYEEQYQLAGYNVTEPAILILDNKGEVILRMRGDELAPKIEHEITQLVISKEGFARIQSAIDSKQNPFFNHERHAAALALAGKEKAAIEAYDRCLAEAIDETSPAAKGRRQFVIGALQKLSNENKTALDVLNKNRAYAAKKIQQEPSNGVLAADIAQMDRFNKNTGASIDLFNSLPEKSRARAGLFDYLSEDLQQQKRYAELLELVDPMTAINGEISLYHRNRIIKPTTAERSTGRGTRSFAISRGVSIVEALAGTRQDELCQQAIEKILDFDSSTNTRSQLNRALVRAGRQDISL